jgi:hypothetical protein
MDIYQKFAKGKLLDSDLNFGRGVEGHCNLVELLVSRNYTLVKSNPTLPNSPQI